MIAPNEWWAVIQGYNQAIFPAQIVLYLLAVVVAGFFLWKPGEIASRLAKGYLVIPFPILIQIPQFGVYEDGIMIILGIYALADSIGNFSGGRSKPSI